MVDADKATYADSSIQTKSIQLLLPTKDQNEATPDRTPICQIEHQDLPLAEKKKMETIAAQKESTLQWRENPGAKKESNQGENPLVAKKKASPSTIPKNARIEPKLALETTTHLGYQIKT